MKTTLTKAQEIKNNEDQIEKKNTINLDWGMKIKINEDYTWKKIKKIKNKKNED